MDVESIAHNLNSFTNHHHRPEMEYGTVKADNRAEERLLPSLDEPADLRLLPYEEIWVTLYPFLLSRGYKLRPRYHPEWIPSWTGDPDTFAAFHSEDGIPSVSLTIFVKSVGLLISILQPAAKRCGRNL